MRSRESSISVEARPELAAATRAGLVSLVLLSCGHFSVDLYSGALGALQPLLMERFHTSLTQAGILGGVLVFSASVMQPVYGYLSDRFHSRLFTVLAPAVAGLFISAMGRASSYHWLLLLVLLGGRAWRRSIRKRPPGPSSARKASALGRWRSSSAPGRWAPLSAPFTFRQWQPLGGSIDCSGPPCRECS